MQGVNPCCVLNSNMLYEFSSSAAPITRSRDMHNSCCPRSRLSIPIRRKDSARMARRAKKILHRRMMCKYHPWRTQCMFRMVRWHGFALVPAGIAQARKAICQGALHLWNFASAWAQIWRWHFVHTIVAWECNFVLAPDFALSNKILLVTWFGDLQLSCRV